MNTCGFRKGGLVIIVLTNNDFTCATEDWNWTPDTRKWLQRSRIHGMHTF